MHDWRSTLGWANQSPGRANTSILVPVPVGFSGNICGACQKRAAAIRHAIDRAVPAVTPDHDATAADVLLLVLATDEKAAIGKRLDNTPTASADCNWAAWRVVSWERSSSAWLFIAVHATATGRPAESTWRLCLTRTSQKRETFWILPRTMRNWTAPLLRHRSCCGSFSRVVAKLMFRAAFDRILRLDHCEFTVTWRKLDHCQKCLQWL